MTTPDTRQGLMTREQADRIIALMEAAARSGGSINVSDPRVSQVQTWILSLVGLGLIAAGGWVGQSINTLSTAVAAAVLRLDQQDETQDDHESRIRQLERKP